MTSTVACPDCHRPATVLDRCTVAGPGGPAEYLRIRCTGPLALLVLLVLREPTPDRRRLS